MDLNIISNSLIHAEPSDGEQGNNLKEMSFAFPYFQGLQLKYAEWLFESQKSDFHRQLQLCTLILPNRSVLYDRFNIHPKQKKLSNPKDERNDPIIDVQDRPSNPPHVVVDELDKQIIGNAISSSILIEVGNSESNQISSESKPSKWKNTEVKAYSRPFFKWLDEVEETQSDSNFTEEFVSQTIDEKPSLDELINRISGNQTSHPVPFFSAQEAAKKSLIDKGEIVSETLAKVYENQGKFSHAIKVYEKLMLINPKKNSYFAGLIKKLKERNH